MREIQKLKRGPTILKQIREEGGVDKVKEAYKIFIEKESNKTGNIFISKANQSSYAQVVKPNELGFK